MPESGVFSCVPFCLRSLGQFARCNMPDFYGIVLYVLCIRALFLRKTEIVCVNLGVVHFSSSGLSG